jgi:hypothetical protein
MKTPELYMLDPSGAGYRFHGCAAGKGANAAKTELEKILNRAGSEGISCRQAVTELGKMYVSSPPCRFLLALLPCALVATWTYRWRTLRMGRVRVWTVFTVAALLSMLLSLCTDDSYCLPVF